MTDYMAIGPDVPHNLALDTARSWGARLRQWRVERNLSPEQVARIVGVARGTIVEWEAERKAPNAEGMYVERLVQAQDDAGENPGVDTLTGVAGLWVTLATAAAENQV